MGITAFASVPYFLYTYSMSNTANVALNVVATGLIALGATSISTNLLAGVIEVVLGIGVYAIYEFTPSKTA